MRGTRRLADVQGSWPRRRTGAGWYSWPRLTGTSKMIRKSKERVAVAIVSHRSRVTEGARPKEASGASHRSKVTRGPRPAEAIGVGSTKEILGRIMPHTIVRSRATARCRVSRRAVRGGRATARCGVSRRAVPGGRIGGTVRALGIRPRVATNEPLRQRGPPAVGRSREDGRLAGPRRSRLTLWHRWLSVPYRWKRKEEIVM